MILGSTPLGSAPLASDVNVAALAGITFSPVTSSWTISTLTLSYNTTLGVTFTPVTSSWVIDNLTVSAPDTIVLPAAEFDWTLNSPTLTTPTLGFTFAPIVFTWTVNRPHLSGAPQPSHGGSAMTGMSGMAQGEIGDMI